MDKNKEEFIKSQIFYLTIMGAFGRNNIYKDNVIEKDKKQFREYIKSLLESLEDEYKNEVAKDKHLANLDKLKRSIENKGKNTFKKSLISFGTVQKLLNLYLKYLWCIGLIHKPPNCPIDKTILDNIGYDINWTKMDRKQYRNAIKKIDLKKGERSIAEWELNFWNNYLETQNKN